VAAGLPERSGAGIFDLRNFWFGNPFLLIAFNYSFVIFHEIFFKAGMDISVQQTPSSGSSQVALAGYVRHWGGLSIFLGLLIYYIARNTTSSFDQQSKSHRVSYPMGLVI
jgi:hypothetical protein